MSYFYSATSIKKNHLIKYSFNLPMTHYLNNPTHNPLPISINTQLTREKKIPENLLSFNISMENLDEYFALESIRNHLLGDFSPRIMNVGAELMTNCCSSSSLTENSISQSDSVCSGSPYCNYFPSDSFNLLQFGPNSSYSRSESPNLVQKQSKFLRLESQQSISSAESVDFLKEESKCFEFDFPSSSFNFPQVGLNSSDLSSESAKLVQNQSSLSRLESQPSISSAESIDFVKKERKRLEFESKPKIIIDLTSPKPNKSNERKPSLKNDFFRLGRVNWVLIDIGNGVGLIR
ncbi:hypothetical protein HAX54_019715 [Datura stramonium]|uniref:Uncharacterized protein n=1 Tax=Datura stramonium TaxID=4076 RepID=A0ABS8US15_DATST|nr:hypothetical protein [Datura stramonium]